MSIDIKPSTEITLGTTQVISSVDTEVSVANTVTEVSTEQPQEIKAVRKEYSIVGDSFYAGMNSDVAPAWLTNLINAVVTASVANGLTDYSLLVQDVRSAIDSINIAKNTYVEQINFTTLVDGIIGTHLNTLNTTYENKFATIVNLNLVSSTTTEAIALSATDLHAIFQQDINSRISEVNLAYANADQVNADSIVALTVAFADQESNLSGTADAVSGLQTYVGLDYETGGPNGSGILGRLSIVEKQTDGVIEYTTNTYDVMMGVDYEDVDSSNDQLVMDALPYVLWTNLAGTGVPIATTRTYKDYSLDVPVDKQIAIADNTLYVRSNSTDVNVDKYYVFVSGSWSSITEATYTANKESIRAAHIADVYIQYSVNVSGVKSYLKSYKFIKTATDHTSPYATDTEGYGWALVSDTDVQASYITALQAKDLADSKRRVFVITPFPPYDKGDLWINATASPRVVMSSNKDVPAEGGFTLSDWAIADEYAKNFVDSVYEPDSAKIHRQIDGKIEYSFYESFADITDATDEADALAKISALWTTEDLRDAANGNVVYFKDTKNAYWYQSGTPAWLAITDTSIYEALQDASNAQGAADGKVSHFYAWGGTSAPENYTVITKNAEYLLDEDANYLDINGDITTTPSEYVEVSAEVSEVISADTVLFWFTGNPKALHRKNVTWAEKVVVPTTAGAESYVASGDILTVFNPETGDTSVYSFNGVGWQTSGPSGIVSKSKWFVDLDNAVTGPHGHVAASLSDLKATSKAYANEQATGVENKFSYDSKIILDGKVYESGFGLVSKGEVSTGTDTDSGLPTFDSEFWVNSKRFVLKNPDFPDVSAIFNVTKTGLMLSLDQTEATRNEPKGGYSALTSYIKGDIVSYLGASYMARKNLTGVVPVDGANWQLLAEKGESVGGTRGGTVLQWTVDEPYYVAEVTDQSTIASWWNSSAPTSISVEVAGDQLIVTNISADYVGSVFFKYTGTTWTLETNVMRIDGNLIVDRTISAKHIDADTITVNEIASDIVFSKDATFEGSITLLGSSYMSLYSSVPFGGIDNEQFLEWTGDASVLNGEPVMADVTTARAMKYFAADGSAYFGGDLRSGAITNSSSITTHSAYALDIILEVSPFTSIGKPKTLKLSYAYSASKWIQSPIFCPTDPTNPSFGFDIQKKIGNGSFISVATGIFTGWFSCETDATQETAGTERTTDEHNISTSEFADNATDSATIEYRVICTSYNRFHDIPNISNQKLTLAIIEE